jgi:hypothetical protein
VRIICATWEINVIAKCKTVTGRSMLFTARYFF